MEKNFRIILSIIVYFFFFAVAIYIGGWVMLISPIKKLIVSYTMGKLNPRQLVFTILKCACSLTVTGFIWCLGYMASNSIYDSRDEKYIE